jgi:hypothetical protein
VLISEDPRLIECDGCGNSVDDALVAVVLTKTSVAIFATESVPPDVLTSHNTGHGPDDCVGKALEKAPD